MIKKIGIILISLAIVVTGVFAFSKLHYWERSVRIFSYKSSDRFFDGRGERGRGDFEGRNGRGQERFERGGEQVPGRVERGSDRGPGDFEFSERSDNRRPSGQDGEYRGGHGRGGYRGGKKVRLANVWWFLAAFSAFTACSIYIDRIYLYLRKRRLKSN